MKLFLCTTILTMCLLSFSGIASADGDDIGILSKASGYNGKILVVTGKPTGSDATECGVTRPVFNAIVIPAGGGQPQFTEMIFDTGDLPSTEDRYDLANEASCSATHGRVDMLMK